MLAQIPQFPNQLEYTEDGLALLGGNLNPNSILEAYSRGLFPWYNEAEPIQWWSPNPRCILFPQNFKAAKSLLQWERQHRPVFKINQNFNTVIEHCAFVSRAGEPGTWLQPEMIDAYKELHQLGFAMSAECYIKDALAGGLYGLKIGNIFFGESMFSLLPNTSKYALYSFCRYALQNNIKLIDCQVRTEHLVSLGAETVTRSFFLSQLKTHFSLSS